MLCFINMRFANTDDQLILLYLLLAILVGYDLLAWINL